MHYNRNDMEPRPYEAASLLSGGHSGMYTSISANSVRSMRTALHSACHAMGNNCSDLKEAQELYCRFSRTQTLARFF